MTADHPDRAVRVRGFVLIHELGRGGTGRVFLACGDPDRALAIKVAFATTASQTSLEREAQVLERLAAIDPAAAVEVDGQHRWARLVTRATAIDEHGTTVSALVLEHVAGAPMRDLLMACPVGIAPTEAGARSGPGCAPRCAPEPARGSTPVPDEGPEGPGWWPELAATLTALHEAGVVHGDLAPGNVIITPAGTPVLVDFEAAIVPGLDPPVAIRGTPPFRPPGEDHRPACAEDDLYALAQLRRAWTHRGDDPVGRKGAADTSGSRFSAPHAPVADPTQGHPRTQEHFSATHAPLPEAPDGRGDLAITREFGPRPPRPVPSVSAAPRRGAGRLVAASAAGLGLICLVAGGHALRAPTSTDPATVTAAIASPSTGAPAEACPAGSSTTVAATPTATLAEVDAPAGATRLTADLDGSGCVATIEWRSDRAEAVVTRADGTITRFQLGDPGDLLVVGDWDGDHRPTPALYRPASGVVFEFAAWASPHDPQPEATARRMGTLGGTPTVIRAGDHDEIHIAATGAALATGGRPTLAGAHH